MTSISQLEARFLTNPYYTKEDREAMREVFRDAERYQFMRKIACLPDDENEAAIALLSPPDDFDESEDGYDAWIDAAMQSRDNG